MTPKLTLSLLVKLASVAVHVEEYLAPGGHPFDAQAIRSILADAEVKKCFEQMRAMGLLPVKRRG